MADERKRQSERRFLLSGSQVDEQHWLVDRLRAGDLTKDRLAFAAYLGHEPARVVAGLPVLTQSPTSRLRRVIRTGVPVEGGDVRRIEDQAVLRPWAFDCVERVLPLAAPDDEPLRRTLDLARTSGPCRELAELRETLRVAAGSARVRGWRQARVALEDAVTACQPAPVEEEGASAETIALRARAHARVVCKAALDAASSAREAVAEWGDAAGRSVEDEASWQGRRLVQYLLMDVAPPLSDVPLRLVLPPKRVERGPIASDGDLPIRCRPDVVAQVAAVEAALRAAVWHHVRALLANDAGPDVLHVDDPRGDGWARTGSSGSRSTRCTRWPTS